MKKNYTKLFSTISLLSTFYAFDSYAITANASATVVQAISVVETTPLEFGLFTSSGATGTINQAGAVTGGVTAVTGVTRTAAVFTVSGGGNASYSFALPNTATLSSGGNSMTATLSFASGNATRTLGSGSDSVTVNGSLAVAASQAVGAYNGIYTVTVAYN